MNCRRLGDRELVLHPEIEPVRQAADSSAWDLYVSAQGGPLVPRDLLRVRLSYEVTENGNLYGDDVSKISGVYSPIRGPESLIHTRTTKYKIVPKRQADGVSGFDLDFSGGPAAPRSSVNNCTREPREVENRADPGGTVINDCASWADIGSLSRKEKRVIAQRLSDAARVTNKCVKVRPKASPMTEQEKQISELLSLRGVDASAGMVRSLISGAVVAFGDQVLTVEEGRLTVRNRTAAGVQRLPSQIVEIKQQADDLLNRMKRAFSARE